MGYLSLLVRDRLLCDVKGQDLRALAQADFGVGAAQTYPSQVTGSLALNTDGPTLNQLRSKAGVLSAIHQALALFETLSKLQRNLVGAICRDQIRGSMLKTDRQVFAHLLGADVQTFAPRHASVFYPALGGRAADAGRVLRGANGTEFDRHPISGFAGGILGAMLQAEAPPAAAILCIRLTGSAKGAAKHAPLTPEQGLEIHKLSMREAAI